MSAPCLAEPDVVVRHELHSSLVPVNAGRGETLINKIFRSNNIYCLFFLGVSDKRFNSPCHKTPRRKCAYFVFGLE